MLRLLRTPRWLGFTALAVVLVAMCLFLGRWQLERAGQRLEQTDAVAARSQAAPVPLAELADLRQPLPPEHEWRRVEVTGRYLPEETVLQRYRVRDGRQGVHVLVPLSTAEGVVLVDRGWVPQPGGPTDAVDVPPAPAGSTTVVGHLRPGAVGEPVRRTEDPQPSVTSVDPAVLLAGLPQPGYGGYVQAVEESPAPAVSPERAVLPAADNPGQNYAYTMQWWLFAGIGVVGWFVLLRREARDAHTGGSPPPPQGVARPRIPA